MCGRAVDGAYGYGTDIGGYSDLFTPATTKELFLRWAEWAALSPVFRLHGSGIHGTHTQWSYDAQTVRVYDALSDPTCSSRRSCARALSRAGSTSRPGAGARAPAGWSGAPLDDRRRVVDPAAVLHALPHPRVRARQGIGEGGQVSPFESGFSGAALPCSCEAHLAHEHLRAADPPPQSALGPPQHVRRGFDPFGRPPRWDFFLGRFEAGLSAPERSTRVV